MRHHRAAWLTIAALVLSPIAAMACPKCFESSGNQVLTTYYLSTAMLTLLPFVIIGAIAFCAVRLRRLAEHEGVAAVDSQPAPRTRG